MFMSGVIIEGEPGHENIEISWMETDDNMMVIGSGHTSLMDSGDLDVTFNFGAYDYIGDPDRMNALIHYLKGVLRDTLSGEDFTYGES